MASAIVWWFLWSVLPTRQDNHIVQDTDQRLVIRLVIGQVPVRVVVRDRGTLRVHRAGGKVYGLMPTLGQAGLDVRFVEITTDPATGLEMTRQLDHLPLSQGEVETLVDGEIRLSIQWIETRQPQLASGGAPCAGDQCCISCGDLTVCACLVDAPCGRCCCAERCPCDLEGGMPTSSSAPKTGCAVR
jgi:hypothetical protein